ncbi:MAG TPA: thiamine pyrophosphate-dependent enzyme [Acidobacteriaceae bacterium]|jgi:hypothetical protein|nr:thiamine pyrophosphate-dependent enzyme [Acidobacteriaceae bacterium]
MALEAKRAVPSAATAGKNGHSLISDAKFRQLYGLALRLHLVARRHKGAGALLAAHVAALAGTAADLRDGDALIVNEIAGMGAALDAELPGSWMRAHNGAAPMDRVVEAVAGAAGHRMRKSGGVAVIFVRRDGAGPVMDEAVRLADRGKLPVLFVEEGAGAPESGARAKKQGSAPGLEMPAIAVDAQDVIAMYRVAHESIARAREGSGPTRIVCVDAAAGQERQAKFEDAVEHLEHWLAARGLPAQAWRREIAAEAERGGN